MLEYTIVEKPQFTLVGVSRTFDPKTSYQEIPKFWSEIMSMENCPLMGIFGVCLDSDQPDQEFDYWIADPYIPYNEIPEGLSATVIPASTWAVFPCRGPLPHTLQDLNTRIWTEWLPNCKNYCLARNSTSPLLIYSHPMASSAGTAFVECASSPFPRFVRSMMISSSSFPSHPRARRSSKCSPT